MQTTSPVSRPAWVAALNALTGADGTVRRSPVEIVANAASVVTRSPYAERTGIKYGRLGRWTDGVAELRADRVEFAAYWADHNAQVLAKRERALRRGEAKRMLVSGVDPDVRPVELAVEFKIDRKLMACCIDLGWQAVDTRSNADETAKWVRRYRFKSVRLVTTDWHMPRARMELAHVLGGDVDVIGDAVPSPPGGPSWRVLLREYHKLLVRRIALWLGAN